jgi:CRISPR-associated protein Csx17
MAQGRNVRVRFPKARTAQAVWGSGTPLQLLLAVAHRRLIDADKLSSKPFAAACLCSPDPVHRLLRNDGSIDPEEVIRWIPALSLIDWSRAPHIVGVREHHADSSIELDGTILLQALARPLFDARRLVVWNDETRDAEPLFPQKLEPTAGLLRRVFNLLRFKSLDEAIQVLRDRYLAAGRNIVMPPRDLEANGELVAASLLVPIPDQAVVSGFRRWLQPSKRRSD